MLSINNVTGFIDIIVHRLYLHKSLQQMVFVLSPESMNPWPGDACVISLELVPSRSALTIDVAAWPPTVGSLIA